MKDKKFCFIDNYSVIVPYFDFAKMMEIGTKFVEMHRMFSVLCKQYDSMKAMHSEMLQKIDEINHYL